MPGKPSVASIHTKTITLASGALHGELRYQQRAQALIITCHGYQSSGEHPAVVAITNGLAQKGYAVFTFTFSRGSGPFDIEQQTKDILTIVDHFHQTYQQIILVGGSFGALSTTIAARQSAKVSGLITINGFFGSSKLRGRHRLNFVFFRLLLATRHRRIWRFFQQEFQPAGVSVPVLVIHSKADELVSIAQSRDFFAQLRGPKQFKELEKSGHNLSSTTEITIIVATIDRWLQTRQSQSS